MMTAVCAEERDLADPATLLEIAREQGVDGPALLDMAQNPAVQSVYDANTRQAVFGMATFVVDDELFWGQDRLDFVARALA